MTNNKPRRDPKYRKHKASGQARVTIAGRTYYLGKWNSPDSKEAYNRLMAQWRANNCSFPQLAAEATVADIILAYWRHAELHYRNADGTTTDELFPLKSALSVLRKLYGTTSASQFGPLALKAVRKEMIEKGWCRRTVNNNVQRVKRVFKWATENELVPPSVYHGLQAVAGLSRGRSDARESVPVRPVSRPLLDGALDHASAPVRAMIELQLLSGMRPGEVCIMRAKDLETSGEVWIYRPEKHKEEHRCHAREIYLGPKAQEVVKKFFKPSTEAYLFSPADAEDARHAKRRSDRKTPLYPSHLRRLEKKRKRKVRAPGDRYDVDSYRRAIARACEKAFPLPDHLSPKVLGDGKRESSRAWKTRLTAQEKAAVKAWRQNHRFHPHQCRHNAGTDLRRQFGIEVARIILGHQAMNTTEIYAEVDRRQAMEVIGKIG